MEKSRMVSSTNYGIRVSFDGVESAEDIEELEREVVVSLKEIIDGCSDDILKFMKEGHEALQIEMDLFIKSIEEE